MVTVCDMGHRLGEAAHEHCHFVDSAHISPARVHMGAEGASRRTLAPPDGKPTAQACPSEGTGPHGFVSGSEGAFSRFRDLGYGAHRSGPKSTSQ